MEAIVQEEITFDFFSCFTQTDNQLLCRDDLQSNTEPDIFIIICIISFSFQHTHISAAPLPSQDLISYFHTVIHPLLLSRPHIVFKASTDGIFLIQVKSERCGVRPNHSSLPSSQENSHQFTCTHQVMLSTNRSTGAEIRFLITEPPRLSLFPRCIAASRAQTSFQYLLLIRGRGRRPG